MVSAVEEGRLTMERLTFKEIAELEAKVEQYRALIPSWVIPMTPKEDTP